MKHILFVIYALGLMQMAAAQIQCENFSTESAAQRYYLNNDAHWLDADNDGYACEHLPSGHRENVIETPLGTLPSLGSMGVEDLFSFTENPNNIGGVTPMPSVELPKPVALSPAADEAVKALLKGPDLSYAENIRREQERAMAERVKAAEAQAEAARKAQNAAHAALMRRRAEQAKVQEQNLSDGYQQVENKNTVKENYYVSQSSEPARNKIADYLVVALTLLAIGYCIFGKSRD